MRYYDLRITNAATSQQAIRFTSHPNGVMNAPDPGALNIEFDLIAYQYAQAAPNGGDFGNSFIRIWGIPLSLISQAENLSTPMGLPTYNLKLLGGMGKGLPLANPAQAGLLIQGSIWRAIGNWIGTDMTLDLFLAPLSPNGSVSAGNANVPSLQAVNNFSFYWPAGQPLASAVNATLQTAFPGVSRQILISPNLVLDHDQAGIMGTLGAFNDLVNRLSVAILGPQNPQYLGVKIAERNGAIVVYDGTSATSAQDTAATAGTTAPKIGTVNIAFTDLIGQPTWLGNSVIQVTCVLRADVHIFDKVTLPPSLDDGLVCGGAANPATHLHPRTMVVAVPRDIFGSERPPRREL